MRYWKWLDGNHLSPYQGYQWSLPTPDKPGSWMPWIDRISPCGAGYHGMRSNNLLNWAGVELYEMEYEFPPEQASGKVYGRRARLLRHIPISGELRMKIALMIVDTLMPHMQSYSANTAHNRFQISAIVRAVDDIRDADFGDEAVEYRLRQLKDRLDATFNSYDVVYYLHTLFIGNPRKHMNSFNSILNSCLNLTSYDHEDELRAEISHKALKMIYEANGEDVPDVL